MRNQSNGFSFHSDRDRYLRVGTMILYVLILISFHYNTNKQLLEVLEVIVKGAKYNKTRE